jgi:hypothetical protein
VELTRKKKTIIISKSGTSIKDYLEAARMMRADNHTLSSIEETQRVTLRPSEEKTI